MESLSNGAGPSSADGPVHTQPVVSVGDLVLAALMAEQQAPSESLILIQHVCRDISTTFDFKEN